MIESGTEKAFELQVPAAPGGRLLTARWAASAARIAILAAVLTPLLIALVAWERAAAVREASAAQAVLRYDADSGVMSLRREAVEEFRGRGRPMTCSYVTAPGGRAFCPGGFGAIEGACADGATGDLLVVWRGTGWLCPAPPPGATRVWSASVLCCK